jgi:hypothetical protein
MSKFAAAAMLACGLVAAPIPLAGPASAVCDAADCVPNVTRDVVEGAPCIPRKYYAFGLDSEGRTFVCATPGVWKQVGPLVGVQDVALPCPVVNQSVQQSNGVPLMCAEMPGYRRWVHRPDTPG